MGRGRRLPVVALLVLVTLGTLLAGVTCSQETSSGKPIVVTTIFPLADFVENVAGDRVEVITLLPSGASPHTYEPTPGDVKDLAGAILLVVNGAGLDYWVEDLKSAASDSLVVLDTSVALAEEGLLLSGDEHEDDGHGGVNPHYWLDPVLAQRQVEAIAAALAAADPDNGDFYMDNAVSYIARLQSLDEEIASATQSFSSREFITFHPAWTYFANRYGLVEAAVIEEAPGKEPSVEYIMHVVDVARALKVKAIFAEPQFSTKAADAIAADSGAEVLLLDPMGAPGLAGRDSYVAIMRYNVAQMAEAMA
jgi:zinc transport system substrate-binding protein